MATNYARGAAKEHLAIRKLRDDGWVCTRTPKSQGPFDILACKLGDIQLIQCKFGGKSAFDNFGPAAREELLQLALKAGGQALLYWWPGKRKKLRIIASSEWPG